jgi:hypothetical protein
MPATKEYVVLVVTKMGGDRWCSIVLDKDGKKYRVNFPSPHHLSPTLIHSAGANPDLWKPGQVVRLSKSGIVANPRITHPEDANFNPRMIETADRSLNLYRFVQKKSLVSAGKANLFGIPIENKRGCPVIPDGSRVKTSCGLVPVNNVSVYENNFGKIRASFTINGQSFDLSATSIAIRRSFSQYPDSWDGNLCGIGVLGLSGSFRPDAWGDGPSFCFVQFNGGFKFIDGLVDIILELC